MRVLIIASVSLDTTIWPVMTSCTRSLSHCFPFIRSSGLWPIRPSRAILSRMLPLSDTACVSDWACGACFGSVDILFLLLFRSADAGFGPGLTQQLLILDHLLQQVFEFVVSDETASQVRQAVAQLEQLAKRRDLLSDPCRLKIIHALEAQFDVQLGVVLAQAVRHFESEPRTDLLHDIVDIVSIDGHELSLRDGWKRLLRHPGKIRQYTDNKRQIPLFNGIANLHVVGDLYSGRTDTTDFFLQTFFRHDRKFLRKDERRSGCRPSVISL